MLSLRAEIAACLFAVSLLGLFVGWMMQRARGARRLRRTVGTLEERHAAALRSARQDVSDLEDRLQELGTEIQTLTAENRAFREGPQGGQASVELNRRQIETQERLQRIIREREREIATLRAGLVGREAAAPASGVATVPGDVAAAVADGLDETVRIDPALLPAQRVGRTADGRGAGGRAANGQTADDRGDTRADVRPLKLTAATAANGSSDDDAQPLDDTLENTVDVTFLDAEEATIALDEETLSLVRGLGRGERKG